MNAIDQAILKALKVNMGYRDGERVAIVTQVWSDDFDQKHRPSFDRSAELCMRMEEVYRRAGIPVELARYVPQDQRNGADATPVLYAEIGRPDIVFMPTVFSLTHTAFRRLLTERGVRVASMPTFTLEMFEEDGPMGLDYLELDRITRAIADQLRDSPSVRVRGPVTDMAVEVDTAHVRVSSGLLTTPGAWGNLPGAEAYAPPVHEGNSNGFFTVPAGWGGTTPLPYPVTFYVERGRFVKVKGDTAEAQAFIDQEINPVIYGAENYNVLAEIGIGTNWSLNAAYIERKGWNALMAEKIGGSAHFANGNSKSMGGVNDVPIHIDWVVDQVEIDFGHRP